MTQQPTVVSITRQLAVFNHEMEGYIYLGIIYLGHEESQDADESDV